MKNTSTFDTTEQTSKSDNDALQQELISKTLPNSSNKLKPKKKKIEDDLSVKYVAVLSYD